MSLKTIFRQGSITNKRFKNLGKAIGIGLFTLLMLTNIKFALMDDAELASGDISVLGIEMQLFDATNAGQFSYCATYDDMYGPNCDGLPFSCLCDIIIEGY